MMRRIGVVSLGCAKNLVDTERMLGLLTSLGHTIVTDPSQADAIIVNTCGFIEPAKQESINAILEMALFKQAGKCKKLIVTGCLSQRYRDELRAALPEADDFLGVNEYEKLPVLLGDADAPVPPLGCRSPRILATAPYRAYLRIADGCNNRCAYCAIPLIRGNLVSEPMEALLDEARRLADGGVTELTVIAQDTSGYGVDRYGQPKLIELLERLADLDGLHWVRVLYTYPDTVTPALIERMRGNGKIVNYLDIPLQHADDGMLKRMNRRGDSGHIRKVMEYVASHAPDFFLRTTMMVGFPGETEAAFERMLSFLSEYPFDRVGAFAFSPEDGTAAADMADQVPEEVKAERLDRLMTMQRAISHSRNLRRVGQTAEVLIEGADERHTFGRSYAEAPDVDGRILLPRDDSMQAGRYVPVRLTKALDYDMMGEYV